jgi:hypothetical protein
MMKKKKNTTVFICIKFLEEEKSKIKCCNSDNSR